MNPDEIKKFDRGNYTVEHVPWPAMSTPEKKRAIKAIEDQGVPIDPSLLAKYKQELKGDE